MIRHAKASSAGSIDGCANAARRFRRALADRGASSDSKGSSARSGGRLAGLFTAFVAVALAFIVSASPASAAEPLPPTVESVSNVGYDSAHFTGTVDTIKGRPSYWNFQYSSDGGVTWIEGGAEFEHYFNALDVNEAPIGVSQGRVTVEADVGGLKGGTHYEVRLITTYRKGSVEIPHPELRSAAPNLELTTLPVDPPTVLRLDDASEVSYTTARVSGEVKRPENPASPPVDPNSAFNVRCSFEFVTDQQFVESGFEKASAAGCEPENPVSTTEPLEVNAGLSGLASGTTYHLRLTASNAGGSDTVVATNTFTTKSVAPPSVLAIDPATALTNNSAEVSGSVEREANADPAFLTDCRFEYMTDAEYQPHSEKQGITTTASGGSYVLRLSNPPGTAPKTTAPIAYDASAATVRAALEALPNVGPGTLTVIGGPGDPTGTSPYIISFIGALANKNIATITSAESGPLVNGIFVGAVNVTTLVEGHAEGFEGAPRTPCSTSPIEAGGITQVSAKIAGLKANTNYHLQLSASNQGGTDSLPTSDFKTTAVPQAVTLEAGDVKAATAKLGGRVNPANSPLVYQFEWGEVEGPGDETYENVAPASPAALDVSDESFHVVTTPISGLSPETTYHYRIVATSTANGDTAKGKDRVFTTPPSPVAPASCPNESSRVGPSANLPDCRAYEWVTPDINNANVADTGSVFVRALADGSALEFMTEDAPDNAEAGETLANVNIARRGPSGWSSKSILAPIPTQIGTYFTATMGAVSEDMTQSAVMTRQPLLGADSPPGMVNFYLHRADGSYVAITNIGIEDVEMFGCCTASADFTHLFFTPAIKQLDSDPVGARNTYEWVDGELRLVGILPGEAKEPAPEGAKLGRGILPAISASGEEVLFSATGLPGLYLRTNGEETVEVSATERLVDPDPNPPATAKSVGISADGSKVLFTSASELTEDANTGESEGVANDAGADLYSYDVQSETLTDLTVDDDPADAATGANVTHVVGASKDASYVYFVATGKLAPGATSGQKNLYVEHDGEIDFIAEGGGAISFQTNQARGFYVTPEGAHAAFISSDTLTAYDNFNSTRGLPEPELYKYTYKGALECASCRPSGDPPNTPAPKQGSISGVAISGRALSDDGSRVFFQSDDAVLPQATNGLLNVYEYEDGQVSLLTPGDSPARATLMDASASGDDVFISVHDQLGSERTAGVSAIYDARVNANTFKASPPQCQGEGCRGSSTSAPKLPGVGSATLETPLRVAVSGSQSVAGAEAKLRIVVPAAGDLTVSGKGLKTAKKHAAKPGSTTISVVLKPAADKTRLKKHVFKTKAQVLFKTASGETSRGEVALKFEAPAKKKGGK